MFCASSALALHPPGLLPAVSLRPDSPSRTRSGNAVPSHHPPAHGELVSASGVRG